MSQNPTTKHHYSHHFQGNLPTIMNSVNKGWTNISTFCAVFFCFEGKHKKIEVNLMVRQSKLPTNIADENLRQNSFKGAPLFVWFMSSCKPITLPVIFWQSFFFCDLISIAACFSCRVFSLILIRLDDENLQLNSWDFILPGGGYSLHPLRGSRHTGVLYNPIFAVSRERIRQYPRYRSRRSQRKPN